MADIAFVMTFCLHLSQRPGISAAGPSFDAARFSSNIVAKMLPQFLHAFIGNVLFQMVRLMPSSFSAIAPVGQTLAQAAQPTHTVEGSPYGVDTAFSTPRLTAEMALVPRFWHALAQSPHKMHFSPGLFINRGFAGTPYFSHSALISVLSGARARRSDSVIRLF
jgi:hypothetical protein